MIRRRPCQGFGWSDSVAPPPEVPLALIGRDGRRRVVLALDAAARRTGLSIGMPVTQAEALMPGLVVMDADPVADALALVRKELWAQEEQTFYGSAAETDTIKVPRAYVERLTDAVCYAA